MGPSLVSFAKATSGRSTRSEQRLRVVVKMPPSSHLRHHQIVQVEFRPESVQELLVRPLQAHEVFNPSQRGLQHRVCCLHGIDLRHARIEISRGGGALRSGFMMKGKHLALLTSSVRVHRLDDPTARREKESDEQYSR